MILEASGPKVEKEGETTEDDETSNDQPLHPFSFRHNLSLFNGSNKKFPDGCFSYR
jgi:hypothetical protein